MSVSHDEKVRLRHSRGRKPDSLVLDAKRPQGRDVIWAAIRKLRTFTVDDLERATMIPQETISSYLQGLSAAGIITKPVKRQVKNTRGVPTFRSFRYELLRDSGVDAPRVTRKGEPVTQGNRRQRMWQAMTILKEFSQAELINVASTDAEPITQNDCADYVRHLAKAGYLRSTGARKPGCAQRYKLIPACNSGPLAPRVQKVKHVYDPNLGKVVWPKELAA